MKREKMVITVLLIIIVAASIITAGAACQARQVQIERRAAYEEHAQQMQEVHASEYRVITGAFDSYHADAYNTNVERIAEQQLLAAEYQLLLLQVIARQNAEMIELMLLAGP